jgi:hypothetical protein
MGAWGEGFEAGQIDMREQAAKFCFEIAERLGNGGESASGLAMALTAEQIRGLPIKEWGEHNHTGVTKED